MFGELVAQLDRPEIAAGALVALEDEELESTIRRYAGSNDLTVADCVAGLVRGFLDQADDEAWMQLVGIMARATEDPSMAAFGAILRYCAKGFEAGTAQSP
jgi:glutathione S-transferase